MSEKKTPQSLKNDKKHRKLVRSPEKLSPCDLDPAFNPSFLSTATNIFAAISTNSRSSPTKNYNDQFPPPHQQVWPSGNLPTANVDISSSSFSPSSSSLPPSLSTPAIALYRKPSITIKYSKDVDVTPAEAASSCNQSPLSFLQRISKSIDSHTILATTERADQASNKFPININKTPACRLQSHNANASPSPKQPTQPQQSNYFSCNDDFRSSNVTTARDIYQQQPPQTVFAHSPTSQSLNLNLMTQLQADMTDYNSILGQIPFNSNNPFLNDTFAKITAHEDEGGGKINTNFFNIDDSNESELLFLADETTQSGDVIEDQILKNKREKFSNASTMKICLVVSPPTRVQVSFPRAPFSVVYYEYNLI